MKWHILTRGAGSQFVMSVPHGALNFVVTEVRTYDLTHLQELSLFLLMFLLSFINTYVYIYV